MQKVVVNELKDDTFYAVIWLGEDGEIISDRFAPERCASPRIAPGLPDLRRGSGAEILENGGRRLRQGQQRGIAALARKSQRRGSRALQNVRQEDIASAAKRQNLHSDAWKGSPSGLPSFNKTTE